MLRYIRKNKEHLHSGYKVRVIKADLAKSENLKESEIILVYKNIILEDSERMIHYKISHYDPIWFGTKDEYDQEFGHHIAVELQADVSKDAIAMTEKVLVRRNDKISHVRLLLGRIYDWITKVKFWNYQRIALQDDQSIEECQLIDYPIIIIGSPIFIVTPGSLSKNVQNNNPNTDSVFMLDPYQLSPFLELLKIVVDKNRPNGSILSRVLNFIVMKNPEDNNIKIELTNLLIGWVEFFERVENNCSTEEDKCSIYRQDYSGYPEDVTDVVILGNHDEHLETMNQLFLTTKRVSRKFLPGLLDNAMKLVESIFEANYSDPSTKNNEYSIVDLRLTQKLTYLMDQLDKKGVPMDPQQLMLQITLLLPDVLPVISKINSVILGYWKGSQYSRENRFRSVYVHPNLDKDNPVLIFSPTKVRIGETKTILSDENELKDIILASSNFDRFYKDDEMLPTDENLASVTVSKIFHFEEIKFLGKGACGSVSLYRNELTNQQTVLKKLTIPKNKKLDEVNEVIREIIAFSKIAQHRRIIQFIDYFSEGEFFYIEMEFMEGGSLKNYLEKNGALNEQEMKHFASQILEGLKYLHEKLIFHRDIKADNVLLDKEMNAKLTDFGLAKCFQEWNDDYKDGIKHSGVGTKRWMAPEIFESSVYGSSADIWSFGMTMIEMVTGRDPYPRSTEFQIHPKISKYGIRELNNKISKDLYYLIDSCLKFDSSQRLSANELLESEFMK